MRHLKNQEMVTLISENEFSVGTFPQEIHLLDLIGKTLNYLLHIYVQRVKGSHVK